MFEYLESVAKDIVDELNKCAAQMEKEALDYENRAKENERKAEDNISKAEALESAEYTKTETYEETDAEGNVYTETREVEDTEKKAAAMQEAANLRAEAVKLKFDAGMLRGLATFLRTAKADVLSKSKFFSAAIEKANKAVDNTTAILKQGADNVLAVLSILNVPDAKNIGEWVLGAGNNLLKTVGIDLSDGLNDELYAAIGMATEWGKVAGAKVIRMGVSYICANLGDKWYEKIIKQGLTIGSETLINYVFNDTGAKLAQNTIATFLTSHGINALPTGKVGANAANTNGTVAQDGPLTFEKAKELVKQKYANYIGGMDNLTEEEKQKLIKTFNEKIDNTQVLSDEEYFKLDSDAKEGTVAFSNGPQDKVYVREGYANDPSVLMYEVGGHGTGTMGTNEGYYYKDPETGKDVLYTGNYADSTHALIWKGEHGGINEAATEYVSRKVNGERWEECAYNPSTDALERITDSMTKHTDTNGEQLLFETYTGDNKKLFADKYNEIMHDDTAYGRLDSCMLAANQGNPDAIAHLNIETKTFERRAKYNEFAGNVKKIFNGSGRS